MKIIGILNYTPDSFSDGGKYYGYESAIARAEELITEGADIIDFGAESTNPLIEKALTLEEEFDRVKDVLPAIIKIAHKNNKLFSIDTYKYQIAELALNNGADIINDQSGCRDSNMISLLSGLQKKIIIMHSLGLPARRNITIPPEKDAVLEVYNWAEKRIQELLSCNIKKENIIFDPGIGLGKTHKQSWEIIKNINSFKSLGVETCVGHSKKGCMREIGDPASVTLAASAYLQDKVNYLRVHDVNMHKKLFDALYA